MTLYIGTLYKDPIHRAIYIGRYGQDTAPPSAPVPPASPDPPYTAYSPDRSLRMLYIYIYIYIGTLPLVKRMYRNNERGRPYTNLNLEKRKEQALYTSAPHHMTSNTTLHHTTLHHTTPHQNISQHATPHHSTPHHTRTDQPTPHNTTPEHNTPHYNTPHLTNMASKKYHISNYSALSIKPANANICFKKRDRSPTPSFVVFKSQEARHQLIRRASLIIRHVKRNKQKIGYIARCPVHICLTRIIPSIVRHDRRQKGHDRSVGLNWPGRQNS